MTSNDTVTEGHWWVKWVQKIEVIAAAPTWTLVLQGAITEKIDPATYESCSAPACHSKQWTDDQNRVWKGVALYKLVGKVDDVPQAGQGDDFDDALADKGYTVQLTAADGATLRLTSAEVKRNDNLIVAFQRDGEPLPTNQWPLRLVGSGLEKSKMLGQITDIKVIFSATTTATTVSTSTTSASGTSMLSIVKGSQSKTYTMDQLKTLTSITGYTGSKNKAGTVVAPVPYKGVSLIDLLNTVGGTSETDIVVVTAADGYTKTLTYAQITQGSFATYDTSGNTANPERQPIAFIAYEADGKALDDATGPVEFAVMTCQNQVTDSSNFVKKTVKIEVAPGSVKPSTVTSSPTTKTISTTTPAGAVVLTVKGAQAKTFTMDQLKAMTATTGYGGIKKSTTIVTPVLYKGIPLSDLLATVGGIKSTDSVKLIASDGYTKTLTYAQATGNGFSFYDLQGNSVTPNSPAIVLVAYETNSQALDSTVGPIEVLVLTGQNHITDSSNFAKMVVTIEIVAAS
jgi:DMSO/TMAO reductase YedYZ molybdopterin-dependent catalytic subunit